MTRFINPPLEILDVRPHNEELFQAANSVKGQKEKNLYIQLLILIGIRIFCHLFKVVELQASNFEINISQVCNDP